MRTGELTVAPGNEQQARAWDGDEGEIWAGYPEVFEAATREHLDRLAEAAAIRADEQVLDIGCGTGGATRAAARAASRGTAVGIDLSARMLACARTRSAAQQLTNVTYVHADAQIHPFEEASFDVAISMTGAMFFADQGAAFANIARALRPNGRLAMVSWQAPELNEWFMAFVDALTLGAGLAPPPPGAPSPFSHADPARTERIVTDAGFAGLRAESLELPMYFGATAEEAYAVLSKMLAWMAGDATPAERTEGLDRLRSTLAAHETPGGVAYQSRAWLYTARRS